MANRGEPEKIEILICDDSAILRRLTKKALSVDGRMHVIAEASNGREALDCLAKRLPDIILLDVEMPVMDGVDTVRAIRRKYADLPVIMYSSVTIGPNSEATIDALAAGANDFIAKPSSAGNAQKAMSSISKKLCEKILVCVNQSKAEFSGDSRGSGLGNFPLKSPGRIEIIGIGASTGGPAALATLIENLPESTPVPILITQHIPDSFVEPLANRLSEVSSLMVQPAVDGEELLPGKVLIAPGDRHLCLTRKSGKTLTVFDDGPPVNSCRPAVDRMFQSMADVYGNKCLGVVLTGMGKDGANGAARIKERGGTVFAQDESTSVVYGMPRAVVVDGHADRVFPIHTMGEEIMRWISSTMKLMGTTRA